MGFRKVVNGCMIFRKSWTKKEQAELLIHLGQCLNDGYPMALAVRLLLFRQRAQVKHDLEVMIKKLEGGRTLYEALADLHFPEEISSFIYFSEESGNLAKGLIESGRMMSRREQHKETLRRLLRYPVLLLWVFGLMMFLIGRFLLPNFLRLYRSLSIDLPLITRILLFSANHIYYLLFILPLLFLSGIAGTIYFRRMTMERKLRLMIRMPLVGHYARLYLTHVFSFHFGSLLRSGLPIRQSVAALSQKGTTPFLKFEADRLQKELLEGRHFEQIMSQPRYYMPELVTVIHQGQLNGMLGASLCRYSGLVMTKIDEKTRLLLSFCQPALLLFVGGLVLFLFASILLPIFHIVNGL